MWRPAAPQLSFHRFLSSLGLLALGVHVSCVLLDHYARVPVTALIGVGARPSVMLGAAAMWLAVALPISFRLKRARFMSHRAWRNLHYFGYAVWALSLCHGIAAGTDSRSMPAVAAYSASAAIVCASAWWRWFEVVPKAARAGRHSAPDAKPARAAGSPRSRAQERIA